MGVVVFIAKQPVSLIIICLMWRGDALKFYSRCVESHSSLLPWINLLISLVLNIIENIWDNHWYKTLLNTTWNKCLVVLRWPSWKDSTVHIFHFLLFSGKTDVKLISWHWTFHYLSMSISEEYITDVKNINIRWGAHHHYWWPLWLLG